MAENPGNVNLTAIWELGGRKGIRLVKTDWWGAGVVVCLEQGADLHMAQLMPLPLTVSCFSKIQIVFTFLVPAHLGSPRKRAVKWVCVCACNIAWVRMNSRGNCLGILQCLESVHHVFQMAKTRQA